MCQQVRTSQRDHKPTASGGVCRWRGARWFGAAPLLATCNGEQSCLHPTARAHALICRFHVTCVGLQRPVGKAVASARDNALTTAVACRRVDVQMVPGPNVSVSDGKQHDLPQHGSNHALADTQLARAKLTGRKISEMCTTGASQCLAAINLGIHAQQYSWYEADSATTSSGSRQNFGLDFHSESSSCSHGNSTVEFVA